VVTFDAPVKTFGYAENPALLAGTPAVVDQPFGAGHAVILGFDSFFRAWREQDERLILNAVLYPQDGLVTPSVTRRAVAAPGAAVAEPLAARELTAVRPRRLRAINRTGMDVRIKVARKDGPVLRRAVKAARLPKRIQRRIRWQVTRKSVTFVVKRARTLSNDHDRSAWVGKIRTRLDRGGVRILHGQL
jgi:hypothetical protein